MKNNNPQKSATGAVPSYFQTTYVPVPTHYPIRTGSTVLDRLLQYSGARKGQILHLCGAQHPVQLAALLGFCKAASDSNKGSVFFDLSGVLTPFLIERAGLARHYNASFPADPSALFRVLSPKTPVDLDQALSDLAEELFSPEVVVVDGLPELLLRHYAAQGSQEQRDRKAGRVLYMQILKASFAVEKGDFTLWFAHSPLPPANAPTNLPPPARLPTSFVNTFDKYCNYGLELGRAVRRQDGDKYYLVHARVWRLGTLMARPRMIHMWNKGQFKNLRTR